MRKSSLIIALFLYIFLFCFSRAYATQLELKQQSMTLLSNAWAQISLPGLTQNETLASLLGDDLSVNDYEESWAVFGFNAAEQAYEPISVTQILEPGAALWIIQLTGSPVDIDMPLADESTGLVGDEDDCHGTNGCQSIDLKGIEDQSNWHFIAPTYPEKTHVDLFLIESDNPSCKPNCSFRDATTASFVNPVLWHYDHTLQEYVQLYDQSDLPKWAGFWIQTSRTIARIASLEIAFGYQIQSEPLETRNTTESVLVTERDHELSGLEIFDDSGSTDFTSSRVHSADIGFLSDTDVFEALTGVWAIEDVEKRPEESTIRVTTAAVNVSGLDISRLLTNLPSIQIYEAVVADPEGNIEDPNYAPLASVSDIVYDDVTQTAVFVFNIPAYTSINGYFVVGINKLNISTLVQDNNSHLTDDIVKNTTNKSEVSVTCVEATHTVRVRTPNGTVEIYSFQLDDEFHCSKPFQNKKLEIKYHIADSTNSFLRPASVEKVAAAGFDILDAITNKVRPPGKWRSLSRQRILITDQISAYGRFNGKSRLITLNSKRLSTDKEVKFTLAHEMFHTVQFSIWEAANPEKASIKSGKKSYFDKRNRWLKEGTASWFALEIEESPYSEQLFRSITGRVLESSLWRKSYSTILFWSLLDNVNDTTCLLDNSGATSYLTEGALLQTLIGSLGSTPSARHRLWTIPRCRLDRYFSAYNYVTQIEQDPSEIQQSLESLLFGVSPYLRDWPYVTRVAQAEDELLAAEDLEISGNRMQQIVIPSGSAVTTVLPDVVWSPTQYLGKNLSTSIVFKADTSLIPVHLRSFIRRDGSGGTPSIDNRSESPAGLIFSLRSAPEGEGGSLVVTFTNTNPDPTAPAVKLTPQVSYQAQYRNVVLLLERKLYQSYIPLGETICGASIPGTDGECSQSVVCQTFEYGIDPETNRCGAIGYHAVVQEESIIEDRFPLDDRVASNPYTDYDLLQVINSPGAKSSTSCGGQLIESSCTSSQVINRFRGRVVRGIDYFER